MFIKAIYRRDQGFTLIEIAIAMIIVGLIMTGFAQAFKVYVIQKQQAALEEAMANVKQGISDYIARDPDPDDGIDAKLSRYPCPADPAAPPGSAAFGAEQRDGAGNCQATGAIREVDVGGGRKVYIGAVPTRTLEISSAYMMDPQHNRLTYAVSGNLAAATKPLEQANPVGDIEINMAAGPPMTGQHFALFSHGRNGAGAYTRDGVLNAASCDSTVADGENCDGDAVFSQVDYATASNAAYYDDTLSFRLSEGLDDQWWRATDATNQHITNKNPGNVGIGVDNPTGRLEVGGGSIPESRIKFTNGSTNGAHHISSGRDIVFNADPAGLPSTSFSFRTAPFADPGNYTNNLMQITPDGEFMIGKYPPAGSPAIWLNRGNGDMNSIGSDIRFDKNGAIAAENGIYIFLDADNDENDATSNGRFAVGKNGETLNTADSSLFVVRESGNVGVGTPNPAEKLHVTGKIKSFTTDAVIACGKLGKVYDGAACVGTTASTDEEPPLLNVSCPDGEVLTGISNNNPVCVASALPTCAAGETIVYDAAGTPQCGSAVPPGTWCGYHRIGPNGTWPSQGVPCQGQSVAFSCPSGYDRVLLESEELDDQAGEINTWSCVKN